MVRTQFGFVLSASPDNDLHPSEGSCPVFLSVFVSLTVCLPVFLSACLSNSLFTYLPACLSVCLTICLPFCLPIYCICVCSSVRHRARPSKYDSLPELLQRLGGPPLHSAGKDPQCVVWYCSLLFEMHCCRTNHVTELFIWGYILFG